MSADQALASFQQVSKSYDDQDALSDVSFQLEEGQVVGLLGPNGAGKSTTISLLLGFIAPTRGTIALFGQSPLEARSRLRIGYLPESPAFPEHHDTWSLLEFHAALLDIPGAEREEAIASVLASSGLDPKRRRSLRKLSKGTLQRLGLAVALLGDPELLILDEPTSNLDPVGRRDLCDLVRERGERGRSVIFSSHVLSEIEATCQHVLMLHEGRLRLSGKLSELCGGTKGTLEQVFLESVGANE